MILAVVPVPPPPFWDRVWASDILLILGFAVAIGIYVATQRTATRQRRASTMAHLKGVKATMTAWGDSYFTTGYVGTAVQDRAKLDYNRVLQGGSTQNYKAPTEPLVTLMQPPGDGWPIEQRTVVAAGVALQRMTVFNQMVEQQTDFNARHATEFGIDDATRRQRLAEGADRISQRIHTVIGDRAWYLELVAALDANIALLE